MPLLPSIDDHMAPLHYPVRHRNGRRPIPVQDALAPALREKMLLCKLRLVFQRALTWDS
jgi:hypothetical protein